MSAGIVIAGGGLAAQRCAEALRRLGHDGPITIACAERHAPYDRPPLSKELLAGERAAETLRFRDDAWYTGNGVELRLGAAATGIDPHARRLDLADGSHLRYDDLVVATGSAPRELPHLRGPAVLTLRDLGDALALRTRLSPGARIAIVGAGFVGLEVAATASRLGAHVTVVEALPTPLAGPLGPQVGAWFADLHRAEGVDVRTGAQVTAADHGADGVRLTLADDSRIEADAVLVATGAAPDTRWLAGAGLPPDGVPSGPGGRTAVPHVLAAGDAARPLDLHTGRPRRQEHWEAAARSGAAAARTLLGLPARPEPPAGFWSDQHGVRVQLVGEPAGAPNVTFDGDPAARDFAATWWRDGRPAAVLLAGRPAALPDARRLVAAGAGNDEPDDALRSAA